MTSELQQNAVIGYPLEHTMSPILHQEIYRQLGVSAQMQVMADQDIANLVNTIRQTPLCLTAVTMPHKQTIMEYLDEIDSAAQDLGAVNTVINRDGYLHGYNTDVAGIAKALELVSLPGKNVLLLGAGGAARSAAYVMKQAGANLFCINRTRAGAEKLMQEFSGQAIEADQIKKSNIGVIINCTPVGMYPDVEQSPLPREALNAQQVVFDIVYNPLQTQLMKDAAGVGAQVVSGLDMFIAQGVEQVRLWLQRDVSSSGLKEILIKTLK